MTQKTLPDYLRERAQSIGMHETGHHIVGREVGFKMGDIKARLSVDGGHNGNSTTYLQTPLRTNVEIINYLQKRVQVLFAGVLAQHIQDDGKVDVTAAIDEEFVKNNAEVDFAKARELVHLLRNMLYPNDQAEEEIQEHLNTIWEDLKSKSVVIVEECNEMIKGIGCRFDEMTESETSTARNRSYVMTLAIEEINSMRNIIARYGPT